MILKPNVRAKVQRSIVDEVQGMFGVVQYQIVEVQSHHTTIFNFPHKKICFQEKNLNNKITKSDYTFSLSSSR